ncbi:MAG: ribulose-phosphate 3-epimerase [Oscillospiraceae bacterium]|nr:ribulose-phosphate 3-epimerase [Oscillospiraceae bacterium]MBQ8758023.1 ribulose-phosphate 3-epimerase [Oscillospiraceae bacterium]
MSILSPSILAADAMNLQRDLTDTALQGAKWLHIDVMDGLFVPNLSFGYTTVQGIRRFSDLVLDVHLMIEKPIRYVEHFCKAGADYLTIHVEADSPENTKAAIEKIRAMGVKPGIVVKPKTPAEAIAQYIPMVDMVLVMTVEPGFGGQKFMADMMPKVKKLRQMIDEMNPACYLEVDGGVDLENAGICKENGANVLVAGSAFYKAADKKAFVAQIEQD